MIYDYTTRVTLSRPQECVASNYTNICPFLSSDQKLCWTLYHAVVVKKTASRHNVMQFALQKNSLRPPCIDVDGKIGCIENPSHSIALWLTVCMRSQLVRLQTIFFQSLFLFLSLSLSLSLSPRRSRKINKEKKRRKFVIFFPCTRKQSPSNIVELKQK